MGKRTNTAVWLEKYNRWQIKVQKDGERRTFTSSVLGRKGQRECNQKADDWLDAGLVSSNTKAQKLFDLWIEELKVRTSKGNYKVYESLWKNWIKPEIGQKKIGAVTEQHIQDAINKAYQAGLAKKSLHNLLACATAFVKYCRKCKGTMLIVENIIIPRSAPSKERSILQPDDLAILFSVNKTTYRGKEAEDPFINAYRFEISTGLRPGEVRGLKWSDITNQIVTLKRSINRLNETTSGKNDNARRTFALKTIDITILNEQKKQMLKSGIRSEYVFHKLDGEYIKQDHYYDRWKVYRDYNNITKATTYELRHTFVSLVKDLPEGLIKPIVGHSVSMDTFGTYGHEVDGDMERVAALIQKQIAKAIGK